MSNFQPMKINWTTGEFDAKHPLWVVWFRGVPGDPPTLSIVQAGIASAWRSRWLEAAKQGFPRVWAPMEEVIAALESPGTDAPKENLEVLESLAKDLLTDASNLSFTADSIRGTARALEGLARG